MYANITRKNHIKCICIPCFFFSRARDRPLATKVKVKENKVNVCRKISEIKVGTRKGKK